MGAEADGTPVFVRDAVDMDGSRIQAVAEAAPSGQLTVTVAAGLPVVVAAMGGAPSAARRCRSGRYRSALATASAIP